MQSNYRYWQGIKLDYSQVTIMSWLVFCLARLATLVAVQKARVVFASALVALMLRRFTSGTMENEGRKGAAYW